MHGYCSKCVNMHSFRRTDVEDFLGKICKIGCFLYFANVYIHWCGCSNIEQKCSHVNTWGNCLYNIKIDFMHLVDLYLFNIIKEKSSRSSWLNICALFISALTFSGKWFIFQCLVTTLKMGLRMFFGVWYPQFL